MAGKLAEPEPSGHAPGTGSAAHADREPDDARPAAAEPSHSAADAPSHATAAPSHSADAPVRPAADRAEAHEHVGPVAIARYVKDDGRALILYTRDPPATT